LMADGIKCPGEPATPSTNDVANVHSGVGGGGGSLATDVDDRIV